MDQTCAWRRPFVQMMPCSKLRPAETCIWPGPSRLVQYKPTKGDISAIRHEVCTIYLRYQVGQPSLMVYDKIVKSPLLTYWKYHSLARCHCYYHRGTWASFVHWWPQSAECRRHHSLEVLGWGLLSQIPPFRYFPKFSVLSKHTLDIKYHVYIW